MRMFHLALLAPLAFGSLAARAAGTITTDGSTIEAGSGEASGVVRIDADAGPKAAPTIAAPPSMGTIGSMTGAIAPFSGAGGGGDFLATSDTTLAGGTYDFATYTVGVGRTVTYSGAVTIRTSGDVSLGGLVTTTADGASITFLTGGDFHVVASPYGADEGVLTTGASAPVTIDAAGAVDASSADGSRMQIRSTSDTVLITSHLAVGGVSFESIDVRGATGAVVRAAGPVAMSSCVLFLDSGDVRIQSFGDAVSVNAASVATFGGDVLIEGAHGVNVSNGSDVHAEGALTLRSFGRVGEDVVIDASSVSAFMPMGGGPVNGDITLASAAGVRLLHSSFVIHDGHGAVTLSAFGGDVSIDAAGGGEQSEIDHEGSGDVVVSANGTFSLGGTSRVEAFGGGVSIAAGDVSVVGGGTIAADAGAGAFQAGDKVATSAAAGSSPQFSADSWAISAGDGGIDLDVSSLTAANGPATLRTSGPIRFRGQSTSSGALTMQSTGSGLDVAGATLATAPATTGSTAAVVLESFGGAGTIDATGAVVKSGDAANGRSGDVTVAVFSPPPPVVRSFFAPTKVAVKRNVKNAALSTITASGWFDCGPDVVDLSGDATLTVGALVADVHLAADKRNTKLRFTDATLDFQLVPSKDGSSRATFTLKRTGDVADVVDGTGAGTLTLRLVKGAMDGSGRVVLTGGAYALGKRRTALIAPNLIVEKTQATVKGGGADTLQLAMRLAGDGTTPTTAPETTISFGDDWTVIIPTEKFGPAKRDVFTAVNPVPGIAIVKLDYAKETLTLTGKKLTLGAFAPGTATAVTVSIRLGNDLRIVDVRMSRKKGVIGY